MGVSRREYRRRREALVERLVPNSLVIVPAASEVQRSRATCYPFRQDSDFSYLCGFPEPDALLVLVPGRAAGETLLFCRERDPDVERVEGARCGPERACERYDVDDAFPIADLDDILSGLIEGRDCIYYALGRQPALDARLQSILEFLGKAPDASDRPQLADLDHHLHDLRLYKSAAELRLLREAAEISARAHCRAMRFCQPGEQEYRLEAEILHEFHSAGARQPAYPAIIAGGVNACTLHYTANASALRSGDLVLVDAGCEWQGYAADITRTFPVSGRFSGPQRALYEVVLESQKAAIDAAQPGSHWDMPHQASVRVLAEGLRDLGLLEGALDDIIAGEAYRRFYMHRSGHWLGMDVHDVGDYRIAGAWRQLESGMVLTVEPGLYIAPDDASVPAQFRGLGIRVEDTVAITRGGNEVLSASVPKEVQDIEHLMRETAATFASPQHLLEI